MITSETLQAIARCAHELNRAYCQSIGDMSQLPWDEAPAWQRESAVTGVTFVLANPSATPADLHASWVREKEADGWIYGPEKDPELKVHPCLVPYDDLPATQRSKDYIFFASVNMSARLLGVFYEISPPCST